MPPRHAAVIWSPRPDLQGYRVTADGRWKTKERRVAGGRGKRATSEFTLTDTSRRARFTETGASWIRLPTLQAVEEVIRAHAAVPLRR